MRQYLRFAAATLLAAILLPAPSFAQQTVTLCNPNVSGPGCIPVGSTASPLPVAIISGGGGGGAGDASAANQALQITQETAINTVLGTTAAATWDGSSAAAMMAIQRYQGVKLEAVRALLAAPLAVTGTFWQATQPVSAASLPLPTGAATQTTLASVLSALGSPFQAGGSIGNTTFASTQSGTWTVQPGNVANTTAWKVDGSAVTQPVSGTVTTTPPANASANVAQIAGTAADTNSGTKSAGTLRVVLATDQPALTNKLLVTPDALPANQSVNVSQINAVTPLMGNGATGTGSQRVTVASDNTPFQVKQTDGTTVVVTDPCQGSAKLYKPVSITTATTTNIITGASAKKTYICHIFLTSAAADNVAIIEGTTGATCGSGTAGLIGGATAANGPNFAANGGMSLGNGGYSIAATATNQNDVCLITSASTPLAGVITYAQQ